MDTGSPRRRGRAAAAVGLVVAALVPLAGAVASVWTTTGTDLTAVRTERRGVLYLAETMRLLVTVTDAESAAVRGTVPDPAELTDAVAAVDRSGLPQDPASGTGTLWTQIRPQVLALRESASTGAGAYQAYSQVTDLVLQQIAGIDDACGLVLDPKGDTYHLVDALTVRLPDMAVEAGRFDDQVTLAGAPGAPSARIAVLRDRIAVDAHAFATELNKVFRSTGSATLGPHLLGDVDLVNTDVDALAPTASAIDEAAAIPTAATVSSDRQAFDPAVLVLETAGLTELDKLLQARESAYEQRRADILYLTAAGAALALPSGWWLLRGRIRTSRSDPREPDGRAPRPTARLGRRPSLRGLPMPRKKIRDESAESAESAESDDPGTPALSGPARRDP